MSGEEVIGADAYAYSNELLVEVTCRDEDGHLAVHSYPFEYVEGDRVEPAEPIRSGHRDPIRTAVDEAGYRFGVNPEA